MQMPCAGGNHTPPGPPDSHSKAAPLCRPLSASKCSLAFAFNSDFIRCLSSAAAEREVTMGTNEGRENESREVGTPVFLQRRREREKQPFQFV